MGNLINGFIKQIDMGNWLHGIIKQIDLKFCFIKLQSNNTICKGKELYGKIY